MILDETGAGTVVAPRVIVFFLLLPGIC